MARETSPILPVVEAAFRDKAMLAGIRLNADGYCVRNEDNLVETVTHRQWDEARKDLLGGRGSELDWKFRAPHSSAALAENVLAPFGNPGGVSLPSIGPVLGKPRFEQRRSASHGRADFGRPSTSSWSVPDRQGVSTSKASAWSFCERAQAISAKPSFT